MKEDEAIKEILLNIRDYMKKSIDDGFHKFVYNDLGSDMKCIDIINAIETILDLYKKTKYELEGKECLIDTMTHNEEVLIRNYEILEKKLQQEKEKNKELENADLTTVYMNGFYDGEKKWKDKMKEKIEEKQKILNKIKDNDIWKDSGISLNGQIHILQKLLKEE